MSKKNEPIKNENIGYIVKYYRKKRGYSLAQLAAKTYLSPSYLNRLELGDRQNPTIGALISIASALEISRDTLLGHWNNKEDEIIDIESFFMYNNFSINDIQMSRKMKSLFSHLLQDVYSNDWDKETRNKEIFQLLKAIDEIKDIQKQEGDLNKNAS